MSPRREEMHDSGRRLTLNRIVNLSSKGDWLHLHSMFARSFWQYRPLRSHVTVAHYLWDTDYYSPLTQRDVGRGHARNISNAHSTTCSGGKAE